MRSEEEANRAVDRYADLVRRLCMIHLKNHADTEDIFQTVFLKYVLSSVSFESEEHERAWFIRVTINACRDLLRSVFRRRVTSLDEVLELPAEAPPDLGYVLEAVLSLPRLYRLPLYLYYYEGYSVEEVGELLGRRSSTVQTQLARGREQLRRKLTEE